VLNDKALERGRGCIRIESVRGSPHRDDACLSCNVHQGVTAHIVPTKTNLRAVAHQLVESRAAGRAQRAADKGWGNNGTISTDGHFGRNECVAVAADSNGIGDLCITEEGEDPISSCRVPIPAVYTASELARFRVGPAGLSHHELLGKHVPLGLARTQLGVQPTFLLVAEDAAGRIESVRTACVGASPSRLFARRMITILASVEKLELN